MVTRYDEVIDSSVVLQPSSDIMCLQFIEGGIVSPVKLTFGSNDSDLRESL
jgi:hypothetical protein